MGIFDGLFGGLFDINGDGKTDIGEGILACAFLSELAKDERQQQELSPDELFPDELFPDEDYWDDLF